MITLKELAEEYEITEKKARKLLREGLVKKDTNYFWKWVVDSENLEMVKKTLSQ